jgi:hypothetical protein
MKEYPAPKPELEGIAVRLDADPIGPARTFGAWHAHHADKGLDAVTAPHRRQA